MLNSVRSSHSRRAYGKALHGFFAYQSTLRVPFLARGPGIAPGTRLEATVRLVDVFPTVLDILGVVFLSRFTLKPLRFFGTLGGVCALIGGSVDDTLKRAEMAMFFAKTNGRNRLEMDGKLKQRWAWRPGQA